ncbi:hypothetical protein GUJ93_ZPchr0004g38179 [Zizania palustris]|uniref:Uncharacterized protein n=1 Tax=Zizania palustris TaxID=103762 RepID=A0A8J5VZ61_ZIZPA|nr:hypothetical protein GUJ93_ZPchr0004g39758 [Zizania palustris]KAG8065674.1 hypothetical protein GUJ93_ZPchr0004g38179 [Zizania palustris]
MTMQSIGLVLYNGWRLAGGAVRHGGDDAQRTQQGGGEGQRWRKGERCGLVEEKREEGMAFIEGGGA